MGASNSREQGRMSGNGQESDSSPPHHVLRSSSGGSMDEEDSDLPSIVAYLIQSGQIRFITHSNHDSDSPEEEEEEDVVSTPTISSPVDKDTHIENIQNNDIHPMVMMSSGRLADRKWLFYWKPTVPNLMLKREVGFNRQQQFTHGDRCLVTSRYLPNHSSQIQKYNQKAFCGIYSDNGDVFLSASQGPADQILVDLAMKEAAQFAGNTICFQDHLIKTKRADEHQNIRVFDTSHDEFREIHRIRARDVGWSVLDTAFSPDGQYAAYSSWSDCVHLCSINGDCDVHEALQFEPGDHSFCIFSLMFSIDNKEILGGANDGHLYVYDRELSSRTLKIDAHDFDVNSVRFADNSSHILYSAGDDGLCKVWDRRTLREERPLPVGTLAGHSDGITYIDSKGDARFLISNCKDQTMKLWDIRHFSDQAAIEETKRAVSSNQWDYRWQQVPRRMSRKRVLKGDSSVMTYRGHHVLHTLIRCKFSPEATTGQRYLYTGCATGSVVIYDLLTGKVVRRLEGHNSCVRDVSWHPYKNVIISSSWDGRLLQWTYSENESDTEEKSHLARRIMTVTPPFRRRNAPCTTAGHLTKPSPFPRLFD